MSDLDPVKEDLLKSDVEFRTLHEEHQQCEARLEALQATASPPVDDEAEIKTIKLHKLALKDRMEERLRASTATA